MVKEITLFGDKCPRCGKGPMFTDNSTGEMFCSNCGFVVTERIEETGLEWRAFSKEQHEDRSRAGVPTSLAMHDMGLATIIGPVDKDASGKPLSASMKSTIERLRTWDSRYHESVGRNFRQAFSELDRLKDKLALGDAVIEKAAYVYRKALEKGLVRGRSISALVAASLFAACRDPGTPRTLKDVANASNIKKKDVARCYRLLIRELDLKMPVVDLVSCFARIAKNYLVDEVKTKNVIELLIYLEKNGIFSGRDPLPIAAAILYKVSRINGKKTSQSEIAKRVNINKGKLSKSLSHINRVFANSGLANNTLGYFQRYPSAIFPKRMTLGKIVPLEISINIKGTSEPINIDCTEKEMDNEVPVYVIIDSGTFEIVDQMDDGTYIPSSRYYDRIFVPTEEKDSDPVIFFLKPKKEGTQNIDVKFYEYGTYLGKLRVSAYIEAN